ncbi:MAG TPA: RDD family protein [Burkholderiaceae bacterium]|nr:RDD family protein [Burkholderiaceae bacterium]
MITPPLQAPLARAHILRRALAFCIDWLMLGLATLLISSIVSDITQLGRLDRLIKITDDGLICAGLATLYFLLGCRSSGQTIGKRITRIAVTQRDGQPCDLRAALLRLSPLLLCDLLLVACSGLARHMRHDDTYHVAGWTLYAPLGDPAIFHPGDYTTLKALAVVLCLIVLIDAITILATKGGDALHDLMSNTTVVQLKDKA